MVATRGPGLSPENPRVRFLKMAITVVFVAGVVATIAVFAAGLRGEASSVVDVGEESAVRAAVEERPLRVCAERGGPPCAWISVVDGELLALSTSGPLRAEFGRQGVSWCSSSSRYQAATGSTYDRAGRVVQGPARRGLDIFGLEVRGGEVTIDFLRMRTNLHADAAYEPTAATGPACRGLEFDRDADLAL